MTFDEDMVISLGNQTVELRYYGPIDGRGSISMLFNAEKLLFVVDWVVVGSIAAKRLRTIGVYASR